MVFGKSKSKKTSSAAVKQRNRRLWIGGGVLCLIAMGFVIGGVYAKYTYSRQGKSTVNAREFYFTSSELDGSTYELNAGTKSVSFHLNNFEDELRVSADDIQYAVKVGEVEKETGTHSSILAQRIPWTEEPGRLSPWACKELDMTEQ